MATVRIAVNHRVRQGEGWTDGEPSFDDVTLWEKLAENAESLRRGDRILGHRSSVRTTDPIRIR